MEEEDELTAVAGAVQVIARVAIEELREQLVPSPAQWARAQALREAREWVVASAAASLAYVDGVPRYSVDSSLVEALTLRWAQLIETGELPDAA